MKHTIISPRLLALSDVIMRKSMYHSFFQYEKRVPLDERVHFLKTMEKLHQSQHALLQGTIISEVLLSKCSVMLCMLMRVCCAGFWIRLIDPDDSESACLSAQPQEDALSKILGSAAKVSASRADSSGGGGVHHESRKPSDPASAVSPSKSRARGQAAASPGKGGRKSTASSPAKATGREGTDPEATPPSTPTDQRARNGSRGGDKSDNEG